MRFADPLLSPAAGGAARLCGFWLGKETPVPPEHIGFPALLSSTMSEPSRRARWRPVLRVLRVAGLALLILALARPQVPHDVREIRLRSRNIMVALDISSSMKAGDFKPGNRLAVARRVLTEFVEKRKGDLIGLVTFAGRTFLQAPLTPDTDLLGQTIGRVDIGMLPDGTAIGTAIAMSLNQLKDLPTKASVIVLITDGANNTGQPSPFVAAEAARALGIRIHAIGLSTRRHLSGGSQPDLALGPGPGAPEPLGRSGAHPHLFPHRRPVLPGHRSRGAPPDHERDRSAGAAGRVHP